MLLLYQIVENVSASDEKALLADVGFNYDSE